VGAVPPAPLETSHGSLSSCESPQAWKASPIRRRLFAQLDRSLRALVVPSNGNVATLRTATAPATHSNSILVKARNWFNRAFALQRKIDNPQRDFSAGGKLINENQTVAPLAARIKGRESEICGRDQSLTPSATSIIEEKALGLEKQSRNCASSTSEGEPIAHKARPPSRRSRDHQIPTSRPVKYRTQRGSEALWTLCKSHLQSRSKELLTLILPR